MSEQSRRMVSGDPCPVCMPVGYLRLDCDGLSCNNCLWNSEKDAGRETTGQRPVPLPPKPSKLLSGSAATTGREATPDDRCERHGVTDCAFRGPCGDEAVLAPVAEIVAESNRGREATPTEVVREALEGEEACVTYGYYGASHRIDTSHASDLAENVLAALTEAGYWVVPLVGLTSPARTTKEDNDN